MTWFATIKARLVGYAVAIAAALAILFGAYVKGRQDKTADTAAERLRTANKARKIEDEISKRPDVDDALSRWMRDKR